MKLYSSQHCLLELKEFLKEDKKKCNFLLRINELPKALVGNVDCYYQKGLYDFIILSSRIRINICKNYNNGGPYYYINTPLDTEKINLGDDLKTPILVYLELLKHFDISEFYSSWAAPFGSCGTKPLYLFKLDKYL